MGDGSSSVAVEGTFAAGDVVVIDMERQAVTANGADATARVSLESDFFALVPGGKCLGLLGLFFSLRELGREVGLMAVPTLYLFDRWDERLGVLPTLGFMTHTEGLGGEDTLEFGCLVAPEKGDRLVWRDPDTGAWREHEAVRTDEETAGIAHVYAESSLCELLRDFVEEEQLVAKTVSQAMAAVAHTRWSLGTVSCDDSTKRGALLCHSNALAALRGVESVWDGELECSYEVSDGRISKRTVSLLDRRGGWHGARFSYGHNLVGCMRTVLEDEAFTALYGWGKGLPIEDDEGNATGGYTRRLSFADVNGGAKWVGDEDARALWGRWDAARGERVHSFGQVVFADCEDASELLTLTKAALAAACLPKVSYERDVAVIDGGGERRGRRRRGRDRHVAHARVAADGAVRQAGADVRGREAEHPCDLGLRGEDDLDGIGRDRAAGGHGGGDGLGGIRHGAVVRRLEREGVLMADTADILDTDGLAEVTWDAADVQTATSLTASPQDAKGRGIALAVTRDGSALDLSEDNYHLYLVWRHKQAHTRGCKAFEAVDAANGRFRVFWPAATAADDALAIAAEIKAARGAGELNGKDGVDGAIGPQGEKGDRGDTGATGAAGVDGVSCTHSWSGTVLTITSASGSSSADLVRPQGPQGEKGETGAADEDGETPDLSAYATKEWVTSQFLDLSEVSY